MVISAQEGFSAKDRGRKPENRHQERNPLFQPERGISYGWKPLEKHPLSARVIYSEQKKRVRTRIASGLSLVPLTGIEPVRCRHRGILSPLRLPVPPQRQKYEIYYSRTDGKTQDTRKTYPKEAAINSCDKRGLNRFLLAEAVPEFFCFLLQNH